MKNKLLILIVSTIMILSAGCHQGDKNVGAIQESSERSTALARESKVSTQSTSSIEDLSQRLFQAFEEFTGTEDSSYPRDIAGTYLDDDELVIILVEGAENPYRELFQEHDPVRFEVAEYAYEELKFMFERLSTILSEWSSIFINVQSNAVSVGYTFEYKPDVSASSALSGNFTLATYLEELDKGKTTNSLGVPVEELEKHFTPHALESVRIFFEEGNFHD